MPPDELSPTPNVQQPTTYPTAEQPKKSKMKFVAVFLIILLVAACAGLGYMYMQTKKQNDELKAKQATIQKELDTTKSDLETARKILDGQSSSNLSPSNTAGNDSERETDIKALHAQVEAYYAQNGKYPTLANLNDEAWRATNMKGLDKDALKDPDGTAEKLVATPAKNAYAYQPAPANCNNTTADCTGYTLTATLSNGKTYVKNNLN